MTLDAARLAARVTRGREAHDELEIENPAVGSVLGTVRRCTADDVELAVQRARAAQPQWARTDSPRAIELESGKARRHAFEEILDVALVKRYYARSAERLLRTRRRRGALPFLTATGSTTIRSGWSA
jgi:succinate-semialdehyde dehydrogenase / glutarate-semialdehyde dehydrogenase